MAMVRPPIYLDYHATTPVDPRVLERMLPFFTDRFGNPASSNHSFGWQAQEAAEQARREVATLIGAAARDIVFTSGATESNNLALRGIAELAGPGRRHIVVPAIEHKSVLEAARRLEREQWRVTVVPVHRDGRVDLDALRGAVTDATALVSVMAANNEIGVLQPLAEASAIAHATGALFHTDAAQAVGKIPIDVRALDVDLLSLTAHKMYGPKGCGALYCRKRMSVAPQICGGGQERGIRSGTLNVPGIVGLGAACAVAREEMAAEGARLRSLRDRLLRGLQSRIDGVTVNGSLEHRLPQNLHVSFAGVDADSLVIGIGDIAVSTGSACSSASDSPSHVLAAIHDAAAASAASIRFGLGRFTTEEEIDYTIEKFATIIRHLHANAPVR
jgi:cysteine desulfurase